MQKIKLICLPFAGGSRYSYYRYMRFAPEWLEIVPVDLPGRGSRLNDPLLTNIHSIVEDVLTSIEPHIQSGYALYGHSMGALTALLLMRQLRKRKMNLPLHLFVTGHGGPSANNNKIIRHALPKEQLIGELNSLDGMPAEILQDEWMMDFFLPVIRADFEAIETYRYESDEKFEIPITCVIGKEEQISLENARAWSRETIAHVDVRQFPGKHFFIYQHDNEVVRLIGRTLAKTGVANTYQKL
jgi:surfactin synthase thioesterase subunit